MIVVRIFIQIFYIYCINRINMENLMRYGIIYHSTHRTSVVRNNLMVGNTKKKELGT